MSAIYRDHGAGHYRGQVGVEIPETSRNWQLARTNALIEGHGSIVAEFFDIGQSRSIPWKRRPQASRLLELLRDPNRGFDAIVIGEPQRAFYGNQFGLTFPVFVHYGVELWVPEVGGPIDPDSEAHDLIMSVFGGMSKGERNRIKIRVRAAMAAQARVEGRYLGGRPPYGYTLQDAGPHPNPSKAADGKRLHRLAIDPPAAATVMQIFQQYLAGVGIFSIAQQLTAAGILCPSAYDPSRNRHRSGIAWSKSAVRAILTNPRYTGHAVWNRQRKQETLIDVDDVALGHQTRLAWNPRTDWVLSDQPAHEAIVDRATFEQAQSRLASRGPKSTGRVLQRRKHPYAFKGLLTHQACGRRMQGSWNHDHAHYRCRYPAEYALANTIDHRPSVYLREDQLIGPLDAWLAQTFHPDHIEDTLTALQAAPPDHSTETDSIEQLIKTFDRKLDRYREALDAGADPATVAAWTQETQAQRREAVARLSVLNNSTGLKPDLSRENIRTLVDSLGGMLQVLRHADADDKNTVYRQLGLKLTYRDETRVVIAEATPPVGVLFVSGGRLGLPHAWHLEAGCGWALLRFLHTSGDSPGSGRGP
ncbi:putative recombinase [Nocardia neocaledoniensis NBRC 108232]|uniref:Resolvase-like protein n=1 Tax=Nocardia neocaledoniensis TaxID=236511 RepID=A0A317N4G1_9NOCA|nr:recombinase family protein [Nocardia neocaledoniensis]PWV69952.1 resolvase-like protein [Nocardia neocaledoniensis]GEM31093.1 putative recombinase [Nocardia neocaledoniensis NBRC 108232]